jgi:hypothetical protein
MKLFSKITTALVLYYGKVDFDMDDIVNMLKTHKNQFTSS